EPEKVGHGDHRWKTADPAHPLFAPRQFTTIRDVLDDPITWSAVVTAAVDSGMAPKGEAQVARRLGAHLDAPAADLSRAFAAAEFSPASEPFQHEVDAILARPESGEQNAMPLL
ncbi:hypothetical protein ACFWVH_05045, partial [Streptomyces sp. NPDC058656]